MSKRFTLYYDRIPVAKVQEGGVCVRTWDGTYELVLCTQTDLEYRIMELILFCQDWHERTEKNRTSPPSAAEFDQYNDLILSDLWQMRSSDGRVWSRLDGAPRVGAP